MIWVYFWQNSLPLLKAGTCSGLGAAPLHPGTVPDAVPCSLTHGTDFTAVKDTTSAKPAQQGLRTFMSLFTSACWIL